MSNNGFFKNTTWLIGGQIFRLIVSFFISTISTRYLGPSNFGIINYISSYISFFTSIIGLGINGVIIYELVNRRDENGTILGTAIIFRLITSIICTISFFGVVWFADGGDRTTMVVAVLQAIQLPFLCLDTINYWYQSNYQSKYPVLVQTIAYVVTSVYKVFLLATGKSVEWFAFAMSLDIGVIGIAYLVLYRKQKGPRLRFSAATAKHLLKISGPFILANVMSVAYSQMDRVMIKQMLDSSAEVGLYSAALNICVLISFIPIAILESGRPLVVEAKAQDDALYQLRFRQLSASILWICALYAMGVTVFARLIIYILYGQAYMGAATCLKIAVWYTLFSYVGSAMHLWLLCEHRNKYVLLFCTMGAVGNFLVNYLLIPTWGINGAAFATLLTQLLTNLIFPLFFRDTRAYSVNVLKALCLRDIQLSELAQFAAQKLHIKKS